MSILDKFKKTGGFQQLVQIIEVCEPAKQKAMLQLVGNEDPGWAHLVKVKALTYEKILKWPPNHLMETLYPLDQTQLAALYQHSTAQQQELLFAALHHRQSREIQELALTNNFSEEEFLSSKIRLIQSARECIISGRLDLSLIDPTLIIEQKIAA